MLLNRILNKNIILLEGKDGYRKVKYANDDGKYF